MSYEDSNGSNILILPSSKYIPLVVIQVLVAMISFSSSIVVMRISGGKLQSVYQRNVFTLTVAIILVAMTLILQPFLVPPPPPSSSTSYYWSSGSEGSCTAVGFLLIFSTLCLGFYSVMLALYFYFSIQTDRPKKKKKKRSRRSGTNHRSNTSREKQPEHVIGWSERTGHAICWVIPITFAATGIGIDEYRLDTNINMCILVAGKPLREIYQWVLFGTVVISIAVTLTIQFQVRDALKKIAASKSDNRRNTNSSSNNDDDNENINNNVETEEAKEMIKQKLSAVSIQCALYTAVCSLCSIFYVVLIFLPTDGDGKNSNLIYTFQILTAIFYPFLGLLNCIIYVRPRVQMLQIMYPDDPYIVVLRVGMSTAGDADEIEQIRVKVFGDNYVAPSRGGSMMGDGEGEEDESGDEEESLGEIPSFVHFDKDKQEMSVYSFVSAPGENDDDDGGGNGDVGGGGNNNSTSIVSGKISTLANPPPHSSLAVPTQDFQDGNEMTRSRRSGGRGGMKEVFGPTGSVLVSSTADDEDVNNSNNGSRSNHNSDSWKRSSDVWSQVRLEDQEEDDE